MTIAETLQSKVFYGGVVIAENEEMIFTKPQNTQDTNYHLYLKSKSKSFLLQINQELLIDSGDLFENDIDLTNLDFESIKEIAWKKIKY